MCLRTVRTILRFFGKSCPRYARFFRGGRRRKELPRRNAKIAKKIQRWTGTTARPFSMRHAERSKQSSPPQNKTLPGFRAAHILILNLPGPMECGLTNPARAGMQQRQFALHPPWSPWHFQFALADFHLTIEPTNRGASRRS